MKREEQILVSQTTKPKHQKIITKNGSDYVASVKKKIGISYAICTPEKYKEFEEFLNNGKK